jgi:exodeoxyribonuclease VII small subunit
MAETVTDADIATLSFEDALRELEEIVRALEQGKGRLEDAIRNYERGAALKAHCERKLSEAEARIEQIALGPGGAPAAQPARYE